MGLVLLGEAIAPGGWLAIGIGLVGVLLLSRTPGDVGRVWAGLKSRAVVLGLGSGFFFAVSGVGYRAATLEVPSDDPLLRAAVSLVAVTLLQAGGMALWLRWREPGQLTAVWGARRVAVWLGVTSMCGTLSWFTAFTLHESQGSAVLRSPNEDQRSVLHIKCVVCSWDLSRFIQIYPDIQKISR
jgi:drug/metabolite transporter (DMT)-like permease